MNAIVLMAIGDRYVRSLNAVCSMFAEYASFCNADLVVCDSPPDPGARRNTLCQKMLLPSLYRQYEWLAYFDIDVLISRHAPSIFDFAENSRAFAAVVDQRGSPKFENVVRYLWKQPAILAETHESYFSDRGFPSHSLPKASINGGIWLCRPELIAEKFRAIYFSDFAPTIHEEAMMAHVAQQAGLFFELDPRWNTQIIYDIFACLDSPVAREVESLSFKSFQRYAAHAFPHPDMYPPAYEALVHRTLSECYCLHFSGGFPFVNIRSDSTFNAGAWPASNAVNESRFRRAVRNLLYLSRSMPVGLKRWVRRLCCKI